MKWINWSGHVEEIPIPEGMRFDLMFREGDVIIDDESEPHDYFWKHNAEHPERDIVKYRYYK